MIYLSIKRSHSEYGSSRWAIQEFPSLEQMLTTLPHYGRYGPSPTPPWPNYYLFEATPLLYHEPFHQRENFYRTPLSEY